MGRIRTTLQLARASWNVLRHDKELLVLPVLSAVASLIVVASFLGPVATGGDLADGGEPGATTWILLGAMYVVLAYVTIFFNAALVHAADERLQGGDPTLGTALRGAAARAGAILPWAIVSATVSLILRAIEERSGMFGRIVVSMIGMAWQLVTFLVLPVLVIEEVGVVTAFRRSKELFKRTWGENVAAQIGFGLLGIVAMLPAVAIGAAGVSAGGAAAVVTVGVAIVWGALVAVVLAALSGVFQAALYHYAVSGETPSPDFPASTLSSAFRPHASGLI